MMTRHVTVGALLAALVAGRSHAAPPDAEEWRPAAAIRLDVLDPRPVAAALRRFEQEWEAPSTYEDVPVLWDGDLDSVEGRVGPRLGYLSGTIDAAAHGGEPGPEDAVERVRTLLTMHHASDGVGRFKIVAGTHRLHVVPTETRGPDGAWMAIVPILDAKVVLTQRARSADDAMEEWRDAVHSATGTRIGLALMPGSAQTDAGGAGTARELLDAILDDVDARYTWRLLVDPKGNWMLNGRRACPGPHGCPPP